MDGSANAEPKTTQREPGMIICEEPPYFGSMREVVLPILARRSATLIGISTYVPNEGVLISAINTLGMTLTTLEGEKDEE